jgi:hypothetical protein
MVGGGGSRIIRIGVVVSWKSRQGVALNNKQYNWQLY